MRVAVLDDYHRTFGADPAIERLRRRLPVDVYTEKLPLGRLRGYPILIALRERTRFDAAFFEALPGLELIAQTGNHAYHIDMAAATKAGVLVGMASSDIETMSFIARSTIELTFGLMLAVLRRIPQTDQAMRRGEWPSFAGRTLAGKKLGILGLGGSAGRSPSSRKRSACRSWLGGPHSPANVPCAPARPSWSSMRYSRRPTSSPCSSSFPRTVAGS